MTIGAVLWVIVKKNEKKTYYFKHIDNTGKYIWTNNIGSCKFFFNEDEAILEWNNVGSPGNVIFVRF
jgi:hypothetical protein